jgi:hypothetical protein
MEQHQFARIFSYAHSMESAGTRIVGKVRGKTVLSDEQSNRYSHSAREET